MRPTQLRQVDPTNAGFDVLPTAALRRTRAAYRRLHHQIRRDPLSAGTNAELNVARYLAELDGALAAREEEAA